MANKTESTALVAVVVPFFYGDDIPGSTVMVDAEEADRLIDLGGRLDTSAAEADAEADAAAAEAQAKADAEADAAAAEARAKADAEAKATKGKA